jgi:hypothetical protein
MAEEYFRKVPNFEYVSRNSNEKNIDDYVVVKNLFKRGKIREDIFENLVFFTEYNIVGDERPDNVAYNVYDNPELDWIILLSNNILNVQSEWPLTQRDFDVVMSEKYGTYENLYSGIHHYEANEVRNSLNQVVIPGGTRLPQLKRDYRKYLTDGSLNPTYDTMVPYFIEYYDSGLKKEVLHTGFVIPVTNFQFEDKIENDKRNIFILKPQYVGVVLEDVENIMRYKKGSEQYVSPSLKRADNIRLWN